MHASTHANFKKSRPQRHGLQTLHTPTKATVHIPQIPDPTEPADSTDTADPTNPTHQIDAANASDPTVTYYSLRTIARSAK